MTRPWHHWLILGLGSCGGVGFVPVASGSVTVALLGIPLFWVMHELSLAPYLAITVAFTGVSVWLSGAGDRILGEKDSRRMVVDEIAGYMVAVITLPFTWQIVGVSFVLERVIDIIKVPPANIIEQRVPGGWGVVGDDLMAGLYTLAIMRGLMAWQPQWLGL
jgi:phosphatidylglycerophosphatase A